MSSKQKKDLPIDVLISCILVKERVRPALLLQPQNYGEATGEDRETAKYLNTIKSMFPELLLSERYQIYQGIIISYKDYNDKEISLTKMGRILGYPCYAEFDSISKEDISYGIEINIHFESGDTEQLFANMCKNQDKVPEFQALARSIEDVLKREEYAALMPSPIVKVDVIVDGIIPTKVIINKLIKNEIISKPMHSQILNIFFNFSFSTSFEEFFEKHFQYNNPVHRGILLSLLLNEQNDLLSPFYPLQQYPGQDAKVSKKIESWENELMTLISNTKTKASSRTRRRRHSNSI